MRAEVAAAAGVSVLLFVAGEVERNGLGFRGSGLGFQGSNGGLEAAPLGGVPSSGAGLAVGPFAVSAVEPVVLRPDRGEGGILKGPGERVWRVWRGASEGKVRGT